MGNGKLIVCSICMVGIAAELWSEHQHPHYELQMPDGPMSPFGVHVNVITTATTTSTSSRG